MNLNEPTKCFIIHNVATDEVLPFRRKFSTTVVNPSDTKPRVFWKKSVAQNALNWWLKGRWGLNRFDDITPDCGELTMLSDNSRRPDEWEVIECSLIPKVSRDGQIIENCEICSIRFKPTISLTVCDRCYNIDGC